MTVQQKLVNAFLQNQVVLDVPGNFQKCEGSSTTVDNLNPKYKQSVQKFLSDKCRLS